MESERELVARILAGDPSARDRFVDQYNDYVWRVACCACRRKRDDAITEDVVCEAYLKMFKDGCRALRMWREESSLGSYLAMIVRNCAIDYYRKNRLAPEGWRHVPIDEVTERGGEEERLLPSDVAGEESDPVTILLRAENRSSIQRAVQSSITRLSQRDQELIERRFYAGQSYKEMAAAMNITVNNVGVALKRAETKLVKFLQETSPGIES